MKFASIAMIATVSAFSESQAERVVRQADTDGNGCLSWAELSAFLQAHYQRKGEAWSPSNYNAIQAAFTRHNLSSPQVNTDRWNCATAGEIHRWTDSHYWRQ